MPLTPFRSRTGLRKRLARQLPGLVDVAVDKVTNEVPYYRHLPRDQLARDIPEVTRQNLELFVRLLREERLPEPGEIEFMMRSAAARAEERIPLPDVLAAYYAGFRACWEQIGEVADGGDLAGVVEVGSLVLAYLQTVTTAVTDAYVETTTALTGRDREARATLLGRVLEATDEPDDWQAAGLSHWPVRSVVAFRHPPPRHADQVTVAVEARRRTRAVREALVALTGAETLDDLTSTGGIAVLRGRVDAGDLRTALGRVLHRRWHAGLAVAAEPERTPEAASAARDCAEVADRLGYPSGVHQLGDLLLEVQVTRPGPARTALRDLLAPLDEHPELLQTLTAYVAEHGRRATAAQRLHVHPNTLDYRLRRIRELTGVDPGDREDGQLARAALVVRGFLDGGGAQRRR